MFKFYRSGGIFLLLTGLFLWPALVSGQTLKDRINNIFNEILTQRLQLSPGIHGQHFGPAAQSANKNIVTALNTLIGTGVASFPLSSTTAGVTFDFSSGMPVKSSSSLGPIFAERALTLGKGRVNIGFNYTYIDFKRFRGVREEDLRFTFTHQDVKPDPKIFGDNINEYDTINLFLNLDLLANVTAFFFTVGITDALDVGVAVPFVSLRFQSAPRATIGSESFLRTGKANHIFGGSPTEPQLTTELEQINERRSGIGDIAFRVKLQILSKSLLNAAILAEYRPPTGDEDNFLGTGESSFKGMAILSGNFGRFSPHLNLSYQGISGNQLYDRLGVTLGYDQKVFETLTFALDLAASFEVGTVSRAPIFPIFRHIAGTVAINDTTVDLSKDVSLTNVPNFSREHLVDASLGFKYHPFEDLILIGNIFLPMNDRGLRANIVPTFGIEFNL